MAESNSTRIKQSTASNFKAHCHTEKGRREINAFLNGLLKVKESLDEQKKSWCWWLLAGGKTVEEFKCTVRSYNHPTICGLVWNKNFVAYRCRDCGISPCMSICADCFHAGNHEGHDFNMFKSQAGGACDCGDESVMSREGFCSRHGKEVDESAKRKPPHELFDMVRIVVPQLCMRLYMQLDQVDKEALGASSDVMTDANELAEFLMSICETDTMKNVVAECLLVKKSNIEAATKDRHLMTSSSTASTSSRRVNILTKTFHRVERKDSFSMECDASESAEDEEETFLDCMMDFVTKLEFPQKIVTFLLHLLPCTQYKESFTRVFCQNYQKIAKILVSTTDTGPNVEQLASRVVHVSVQLYSNKQLAEKMVKEQNFLQVMVRVLHDMIKPALESFKRGQEITSQLVVNCDNRALKDHCYWPIVTDFINVLSHKTIAETFMTDHDLVRQWVTFIQYLTGMNISRRQLITHVEFEPTAYCTSFSVELEAASSPLWSMINACTILNSEACVRNMIQSIVNALESWYQHGSAIMPKRDEVTFHLPLHRYLSGFLSLAMSHFNLTVDVPQTVLAQMIQHLLQIQAAVCEINAGRWVRNGNQIRSQVRLYVECHFCNSMVDLDIFLLQLCAANLDPDDFLNTILERFGIKHWFRFGALAVPTPSCFDSDSDISMVKGALTLILTLLNSRLYLGQSNQDVIRQEMVTQLCIGDKTHSQLVELIPDKPGQSHKIQDFEKTLNELADYKAPSFESGLMQQGKYAPKDKVWESEFDPIHVFHRVVQRQDIQSAMSRYSAYINKNNQSSNTLWPPFKPLKPLPKGFEGVLRLLNCKTMHGMLYYIFHQVTMDNSSIPDAVLYLAVHLTSMSIENTTPLPRAPSMVVQSRVEKDIGCQIAMRCIDHLEMYGKHVKGLHQTEDLRHINADLVSKLQKDPTAPIDPQHFSCHEVCVVMACSLHHIMQPPLFDPFLPFMARVLNSALTNRSNTHEKVAQLQHIQFLLELLPQHRQTLVRKLTKHLLSVSERYKIPTKNLVLVSDDTQPMELSMLLMYLIKYHDWLFRVRTPNPGWPCTIADLDFTSLSMVNNIRHTVGIVTDQSVPMDTSDKETGSSLSSSQPSLKPSIEGDANGSVDFQRLVQEFMAITEASESVARNLLYTCKGNLEVAINIHLNMEDTIPDVIPCPDSAQSTSTTGEGSEEIASVQQPVAINESILSLLLKIKTNLQSSSSSNTPSFGTGIYYINKVFELASKHSVENSSILSAIDSPQTDPSTSSPGDDADNPAAKTSLRRQRARERQQKLLAEFASKQKTFMERALKKDPDALDMSMDVDGTVPDIQATSYECVICGESSPSTEERPVGLVALLQPSAVLKHRSLKPQHNSSGSDPVRELQCGTFVKSRMNAFSQHFSKDDSLDTLAAGCNGGIHVQTCGHYLHVDCQQSYLRSLQEEEAAQLHQMHSFNPRNGDFTCPLCRQLGNCVLPEIPSRISTTREESRPVGYAKCLNLHEEVLRKYNQNCMTKLTKSALNFSVLGASIKTVTEIVSMLESSSDDIKSDKRFSFIYRTLRTNLELEHVDRTARKLSAPKKSCFGSIFRAFQFHCQTIVAPMIRIWSELSNIEIPENTSTTANKATGVPVLLRDGPSLLIQMMLSWPTAISQQDFQCFVQVVYNLVFTQALVHSCCKFVGDERLSWQETGKKATLQEKSPKKSPKPLTVDLLLGFVTQVLSSSNLFKEDNQLLGISQSVWSPHMVEQSIRDFCLPYLKLCSLISSLCFDTALPTVEAADQEFQAYAASLGMYSEPGSSREAFSCADCLRWQDNERPLSVIRKWCDSLSSLTRRYEIFSKSEDLIPVTYHWPPPSLIALPERYDTLIQHYRKQKCSKCGTKPDDPAICLVCGQFVCLQGTCCMATQDDVRRYECIQHAVDCGAGTGVFLIVLSSVTIVIRADRVCIWGSVYLDSFGEEDRDLRRGKPLFLSQDRFKRLEEQWFTHSFDHTCKRWKRHLNTL